MDGMTYAEIAQKFPMDFEARKRDKLQYRCVKFAPGAASRARCPGAAGPWQPCGHLWRGRLCVACNARRKHFTSGFPPRPAPRPAPPRPAPPRPSP
jgi:hypothetical protein